MNKEEIFRAIDKRLEESVQILTGLISFPSTRGNEAGPGRFLLPLFERCADSAELIAVPDSLQDDPDYAFRLAGFSYGGAANLRVRLDRTGPGASLALNTHLDVVPATPGQEAPFQARVQDGQVFGRGACDAKGQAAVIWLVIRALKDLRLKPRGGLTADLVLEEECGGNGTLLVQRNGLEADAAIVLEPTALEVAHLVRGAVWFEVRTTGIAGHSGSPGTTSSALKTAIRVMEAIESVRAETLAISRLSVATIAKHPDPAPCTFGILQAGNWPAAAPSEGVLKGVFGFLPPFNRKEIQERLVRAVSPFRARITFPMLNNDPSSLPSDHPLVQAFLASAGRVGVASRPVFMNASCDAWRYSVGLGIPTVVFGPGSLASAHSKDEHIAIDDIRNAAAAVLGFIDDWSGLNHVS
ncbi:MAG TPA: M20/M25/M40 family metallo-hydrolase [Candidatus Aminicenantes bacterium]|nr:M20/M25/M40 family metallo-hydrolase [Candidatus Aminicenantes bacterium]HRY65821.1 M20/M25/M40 family metallo-hydrolase [Candidatus Aminicenantes bacterium]HRZ72853.1 M20/M25/M40 family metallo-hydrolase [Candidatus Aminicenantes bacterium]